MTSGVVSVFSACWFDSGYMVLPVYEGFCMNFLFSLRVYSDPAVDSRPVPVASVCGHGARGSDCRKLLVFRSCSSSWSSFPCRGAEAGSHGPCDHCVSPVARVHGGRCPVMQVVQISFVEPRQIPMVQTFCRTTEFPKLLHKVIDVPVVQVVHFFSGWCLSSVHRQSGGSCCYAAT